MNNYQEWFSVKELMEKHIEGLPSSDKGIVKKAIRESWIKRQRKGVKGKTFEYHYSSFPLEIQQKLGFKSSLQADPIALQETLAPKLEAINKLESSLNTLLDNLKTLNTTNPLNHEEKCLIYWFRLCHKDKQAILLSSAETFANTINLKL